jgi:hypothetical protein
MRLLLYQLHYQHTLDGQKHHPPVVQTCWNCLKLLWTLHYSGIRNCCTNIWLLHINTCLGFGKVRFTPAHNRKGHAGWWPLEPNMLRYTKVLSQPLSFRDVWKLGNRTLLSQFMPVLSSSPTSTMSVTGCTSRLAANRGKHSCQTEVEG